MTQYHRDQASDSEEIVTSFMQDGTYSSRNFATLGTLQPPFGIRHAEDQTFTNPVGGNIFRNQLSSAVVNI